MLRFVADNLWLFTLGAFGIVSIVIIGWSARRRRATGAPSKLPGIATAVASGIILGAALAFANQAIAIAVGVPNTREGFFVDYVLIPFAFVASLVFLAVLDVCAIWPPRSSLGALGRAILGVFLLVVAGRVIVGPAYAAVDAAVTGEVAAAQQELQGSVDARAAAVSMSVDVIGVEFAGTTANGRIVSHLTVDVSVRSTADIELLADGSGLADTWIHFGPPNAFGVQPEPGLDIPAHLPAGFDRTYRLELPVDELRIDPTEQFIAGPWTASLFMTAVEGEPGSHPLYEITTSFDVSDAQ